MSEPDPIAPAAAGLPWRDPVEAAGAVSRLDGAVALLSDGGPQGRWSFVAAEPDRVERLWPGDDRDGFQVLREMLGPRRPPDPAAPPFRGGVIGLAAYEYAARLERLDLPRRAGWPDLTLARYPTVLAFDHHAGTVRAFGDRERARAWLDLPPARAFPGRLADDFAEEGDGARYEAAVADVVGRIGAGEIFQANIARTWGGSLAAGAEPFDLLARLAAASPAPFAALWRLEDLAVVSNSPERFLRLRPGEDGRFTVETRPIKGTRPRGATPRQDAALARDLLESEKDRAENLMIVDLMRNDLSRVCRPGAVATPELFRVERYANVQHLVSTVTGQLAEARDAADLLRATFPPGSITGAPKVQAMRVIAGHEPPRGPWCGSLFWAGFDGALDSSVLIRTAALTREGGRWRFRASAGAGIVADSDPVAERQETDAKIAALRRALTDDAA